MRWSVNYLTEITIRWRPLIIGYGEVGLLAAAGIP